MRKNKYDFRKMKKPSLYDFPKRANETDDTNNKELVSTELKVSFETKVPSDGGGHESFADFWGGFFN